MAMKHGRSKTPSKYSPAVPVVFSDIADSYKPIIVSVKGICASACYYAVSPADAIYADSNALIGSIGVRMDHWNLSEIMSTVGVKNEPYGR